MSLFRHRDKDMDPAAIGRSLSGLDCIRLAAAVDRYGKKAGPCGLCGEPTVNLRPMRINPPESQYFGGDSHHSNVLAVHLCHKHDNPTDAATLRAELINQARTGKLAVPEAL